MQDAARIGADLEGAAGDEISEPADPGRCCVRLREPADPFGDGLDGAGGKGGPGAAADGGVSFEAGLERFGLLESARHLIKRRAVDVPHQNADFLERRQLVCDGLEARDEQVTDRDIRLDSAAEHLTEPFKKRRLSGRMEDVHR